MKKIVFLPYDFDTAIGINNEGSLTFGYNLEDIDKVSGNADVFNGQESVLWKNMRTVFFENIRAMYQNLRSTGKLSYQVVEQMFEEHQGKWSEAIFNEDAYFKYLQPLIDDGSGAYLAMLQGSKAEQRKWWLYNRFRYLDSKYNAGDALTDVIQLRGYAKDNITVTPYADVYPSVKYGSYLVQERGTRNVATTLVCPLDALNDTEIYIYSASQLSSIGDISGLMVGFADFSMGTKLQSLKIGDSDSNYSNGNLTELTLGNNTLLTSIDVRNCPNLTQAVDLSGCSNIENVYFGGTAITACSLPNGGVLKVLQLPETITNLTIRNQPMITTFSLAGSSNITTLRLENVSSAVDGIEILNNIPANSRVRLIGFEKTVSTTSEVDALVAKLDTMRGLDEQGNNVETAQVSGTIKGLGNISGAWLASIQAKYPDLTIEYDHITSYLYYYNYDGTQLLNTETIQDGGNGTYSGTPSRASTAQYTYTFEGWSTSKNQEIADANALKNVVADRNVYAVYSKTLRTYTATFVRTSADGGGTLYTQTNIPYGTTPTYGGETPTTTKTGNYDFDGWTPALSGITGDTTYTAVFMPQLVNTITDSLEEIVANINSGTFNYEIGDTKKFSMGELGGMSMQLVAKNADELANESGNAKTTWIFYYVLNTHIMNPFISGESPNYEEGTGSIGGWDKSEMKQYIIDTVVPNIPVVIRNNVKAVKKYSKIWNSNDTSTNNAETSETFWIPSEREMTGNNETRGAYYSEAFPSADSRKKTKIDSSASYYWLRSARARGTFALIGSDGNINVNISSNLNGVVLGFCI